MWGVRFAMARALLAHAHLGPSFHPFALQTANWICNRLPSASRSWHSSYFLLARRSCSIAYLRSFGCLVRVFLSPAQRSGDRHFSDRGALGIYLGPSETSPAAVTFVPSRRQFFTSRHVVFYEDVFPGVRGVDSAWRALDQEGGATARPSADQINQELRHPCFDPLPTASASMNSDAVLPSPDSSIQNAPIDNVGPPAEITTNTVDSHDPSLVRIPRADSADSSDPSSRFFVRNLPQRTTRYQGAYYVNPTTTSIFQAVQNAQLRHWWECGDPHLGACLCYLSSISGVRNTYVVTSTSDMGDLNVPRGYRQALASPESHHWREAIAKELNGLIANGTWVTMLESDLPPKANLMRCHMVFTVKRLADGSIEKFKCRLVADGNTQRYGVDFHQIFSTVAKLSTLRVVLTIAAAKDFNLTSIDIRQAYLQATVSEDLYMQMPPGLPKHDANGNRLVVKLTKSLYGLRQAGREWANLLSRFLVNWGFNRSTIDVCLYVYSRGICTLYVVVWVDDCVIVDNSPRLRDTFVQDLGKRFPVDDKGTLDWILQVKVTRNRSERSLDLSQELYISDLVHRFNHLIGSTSRRFDSPCDASLTFTIDQCPAYDSSEYDAMAPHRETYMSLVGAFLWLANVTRFELSFISSQLARFVSNPGRIHFQAALRVLIYLQCSKDRSLSIRPHATLPVLRVFVDSNWGTRFSVSAAIFDFMGTVVHWLSKTQRSVSMSSTEAEFFAACVAARDVLFLRDLLADLGYLQTSPTPLRSDNKSVSDLSFDPVAFKKTKHILRAAEFLRDIVSRRQLVITWMSGADNVADLLTKAVTLPVFRHLISRTRNLAAIP